MCPATHVRVFVALNLDDALRARIETELLEPLREMVPGVRWTPRENLHVTLAFLGDRSPQEVRDVEHVLRDVAADRTAFDVRLSGLGVFPNASKPRVVWLGLEDPSYVRALHRSFERERGRLGVAAEGRAYHPHVTLGRVTGAGDGPTRAGLARALSTVNFEATVRLTSVDLMQSDLTPAGSRYTRLVAIPLEPPEER